MELKSNNIIVTPKVVKEIAVFPNTLNQSSLVTYSKIVCCMCSSLIDANPSGICEACARKQIDITAGIPKNFTLQYCRTCDRYYRPPWIKVELESSDMMALCISKIKNLNKARIVDSSFIYTEPHSKLIKVKLTLQKEFEKNIITQNCIMEYRVEWNVCFDCNKTLTPHFWYGCVQLRQKVKHKKTFLYLEQVILKNKMHKTAITIKEVNEGVDFFFNSKHDAGVFADFIGTVIPTKKSVSKHVVSHSNQQHTFVVDIAPVWKNDLIFLNKSVSKSLGAIGPLVVCDRVSSKIRILDPITFDLVELDSNTYWKYEFKTNVDTKCLTEFMIIDVEEQIDYKEKYKNKKNEESSIGGDSIVSNSTNYKKNASVINNIIEGNEYKASKNFIVKCIRNNSSDSEILEIKSHLAYQMKPGDIYLGYDLTQLNFSSEFEEENNVTRVQDVILIKKKTDEKENKLKLKHLKIEKEEKGKKKKKEEEEDCKEYEDFIDDVIHNEELKQNVVVDNGIQEEDDLAEIVDKLI